MANTNTAALFLIQIHWLVAATDTDKISCSALSAINDEQCRHTNAGKALTHTNNSFIIKCIHNLYTGRATPADDHNITQSQR